MKDHLIFDVTDATTQADSDSVGAYVRAGTDGTLIGHVSDALKVSVANASIAVTATDLDIRDLTQADEITVFQGTSPWVIGDGGGSITVDGSVSITGNVTVDQGTSPWVVSATDLDIRDLSHSQDSIKIGDGTDFLAINADGSINVNADISVSNGHEKAEDAAHASGDIGSFMLAVRQDTLASSVDTDGDYAALKVNSVGALYVDIASSSGTLTVSDAALANTALAHAANTLDTADTAELAIASALANRKYLWIYNNDNTKIYLGNSGVTPSNGFPVSPGSYLELRAGAAIAPYFIGQSGKTPEIRTLELS